ncbi:MAG: hypothetical protein ABJA71_08300 [Ginsengibacter sp.]
MKAKRAKHIQGVIDEYITLLDEQIEIPVLIEKANEKYNQHITEHNSYVYKPGETDDMFKIFMQIKKYDERKAALNDEFAKTESTLKDFLTFLKGGKISYEKRDDNDKSKITFLFWLQDGKVMCNR